MAPFHNFYCGDLLSLFELGTKRTKGITRRFSLSSSSLSSLAVTIRCIISQPLPSLSCHICQIFPPRTGGKEEEFARDDIENRHKARKIAGICITRTLGNEKFFLCKKIEVRDSADGHLLLPHLALFVRSMKCAL